MDPQPILDHLAEVRALRDARAADPAHAARVRALKDYQARRFERTYADLLASPSHAAAARFFLDELYGPQSFDERDAQFVRIVPAAVRFFPDEVAATIARLAELHALSERLDDACARALPAGVGAPGGRAVDAAAYARAWRAGSTPPERARQIEGIVELGRRMRRHTSQRSLRTMLRMMRAPASAAGFGALQAMLERGFDAYAAMGGAGDAFLATVAEREHAIAAALFAPAADGDAKTFRPAPSAAPNWQPDAPLAMLP